MQYHCIVIFMIAIIHSPHGIKSVKIIFDGFEPNTTNSQNCFTNIYIITRMILDEAETLENLPPYIIVEMQCPHYPGYERYHIRGAENGGWNVTDVLKLKYCVAPDPQPDLFSCSLIAPKTYLLKCGQREYTRFENCTARLFLGEVRLIRFDYVVTNYHGLKGLSQEIPLKLFVEAPYYSNEEDHICARLNSIIPEWSKNEVSFQRPPTDVFMMICGVMLIKAVLNN